MNRIFQFFLLTALVGCNTAPKHNATVSSTIKGLQKGTAYLQMFQDSAYITVDSLSIKGTEFFVLSCELQEPEVLYLSLSNQPTAERIEFFASEGNTTINTSLKRFVYDAKIEGNVQQELLNDYRANLTRFKNKQLELIEASLNAQRTSNKQDIISTENEIEINLKRQYLYSRIAPPQLQTKRNKFHSYSLSLPVRGLSKSYTKLTFYNSIDFFFSLTYY